MNAPRDIGSNNLKGGNMLHIALTEILTEKSRGQDAPNVIIRRSPNHTKATNLLGIIIQELIKGLRVHMQQLGREQRELALG